MPNVTTNHAITFTNFELTYRENYGRLWKAFFCGEGGGGKLIASEKLMTV